MGRAAKLPRVAYDDRGLAGVLPRVARSLGVPVGDPGDAEFPEAGGAVVVLVDGLGLELLRERSGHAPWLRTHLRGEGVTAGFPSTTATSMGSFGTGREPGAHGMLGYQVLDPATGRLFNELTWAGGPEPERWQPVDTVFERVGRHDRAAHMVTQPGFEDSGLTRAALRGVRVTAADDLDARVAAALRIVRADPRALLYLYWGHLDRVGHQHGCGSWQWGDELEAVDRSLRRLAEGLPAGVSLTITADHGMVDVPLADRVDVAHDPELAAGVAVTGGEVRALQLHCRPGAAADVIATWRARFGAAAWVLSRDEAVHAGLFGRVDPAMLARLGDVTVAMRAPIGVSDSRFMPPRTAALLGQHGSLTPQEQRVPAIHLPPGTAS